MKGWRLSDQEDDVPLRKELASRKEREEGMKVRRINGRKRHAGCRLQTEVAGAKQKDAEAAAESSSRASSRSTSTSGSSGAGAGSSSSSEMQGEEKHTQLKSQKRAKSRFRDDRSKKNLARD